MAEMQQLSDKLHSVLKIAEEAQTGSPSASLTDSLDHWEYNTVGDEAQWKEFRDFMGKQARENSYPKYLYRAHVHGHPYPRVLDDSTGEYINTFGSDLHLFAEYDADCQIFVPICNPMELYTVDDFFSELNLHLGKTGINLQAKLDGEEQFLSSFVSLSSDFHWTAQRTCRVGRMASKDQIPGLAIFETSKIGPNAVGIWRVTDLLLFLDTKLAKSSVHISSNLRKWAANACEYVCWGFIPLEALVAFTPLPKLIETFNGGERAFLTKHFVGSNYLGDFRRCPPVHLSRREYVDRASKFVCNIITDVSSLEEAKQLFMYMEEMLLDHWLWGYKVAAFVEDLDEEISSSVEKALETAFVVK